MGRELHSVVLVILRLTLSHSKDSIKVVLMVVVFQVELFWTSCIPTLRKQSQNSVHLTKVQKRSKELSLQLFHLRNLWPFFNACLAKGVVVFFSSKLLMITFSDIDPCIGEHK